MAQVYLAQWEWGASTVGGLGWRAPGGTAIGCLDLRTLPEQATAAAETPGLGVFVYDLPQVIANSMDLGMTLDRDLTGQERNILRARLKLADPIPAGTTVLDFFWNCFTVWSDPTGELAARALMPARGHLALHLGGFSPIRVEPFSLGHAHAPKVIDTVKHEYRKQRTADLAVGSHTYRRMLDTLATQYQTDPEIFIPADLPRETPLPHATTIGDAFTRADNTNLNAANTGKTLDGAAGTWSWTETINNLQIVSNAIIAAATTNQNNKARAEQDLSSVDHSTSILTTFNITAPNDVVSKYGVALARYAAGADTQYMYFRLQIFAGSPGNRTGLVKNVAGVSTDLDAQPTLAAASNETVTVKIEGSTLSGLINGVVIGGPLTDTAIAGNLRTGLQLNPAGGSSAAAIILDDFSAIDIEEAPAPLPSTNRIARQGARRRHPSVSSPGGYF